MCRSVSHVVLDVSSLKGHRVAGDGCEGAVRSFAATSDGAPSSLHRRLGAGYCRILPDIAGFWCLCFTWFYQQYPAISSTIQPKTIQMTTSQSLVDRSEGWQLLRGPLAIQRIATPRAGRDRCGHPQRFWWRPSMKSFHVVKPKRKASPLWPENCINGYKWVIWTILN